MTGRWNGPVAATTKRASMVALRRLHAEARPADVPAHRASPRRRSGSGRRSCRRRRRSSPRPAPSGRRRRGRRRRTPCPESGRARPGRWRPASPTARERQRSAMRCALEHEVRHAALAQMLAHRDPGLAGADDEDLDLFSGHHNSHSRTATRSVRCMLLGRHIPCPTDVFGGLHLVRRCSGGSELPMHGVDFGCSTGARAGVTVGA